MNLHQVLTGAANQGDYCLSVGSVDGSHFTAYAAGNNIVVLDGQFNRVQVISGSCHGLKSEITCIVCCRELGKIAASCEDRLYIFEPVPVVREELKLTLNYQWSQSSVLVMETTIVIMAWNYYGSRLITSLSNGCLQMWEEPVSSDSLHSNQSEHTNPPENSKSAFSKTPEFFIGDTENATEQKPSVECVSADWVCSWTTHLSNAVVKVKFSSDGLFFATSAHNDKLVKIWYEDLKATSSSSLQSSPTTSYSSIFVSHPRPVTGFTWRRSSKYIQKGCIANMLLTTCEDAICRIWSETFLPDDPLTDAMYSFESSSATNTASSFFSHFLNRHRHHRDNHRGNKHRFMHRLSHIRKMLNTKKRRFSKTKPPPDHLASHDTPFQFIPDPAHHEASLPCNNDPGHPCNNDPAHPCNNDPGHPCNNDPGHPCNNGTGHPSNQDLPDSFRHILADVHFHLAASIDFATDIPMRGSFENGSWPSTFVTHWLNNKEFQTNSSVEGILASLSSKHLLSSNHYNQHLKNKHSHLPTSTHPSSTQSPVLPQSPLSPDSQASDSTTKSSTLAKMAKHQTNVNISTPPEASLPSHFQSEVLLNKVSEEQHDKLQAEGGKEYDDHMDHLIQQWNHASDVLFSIHPVDGSLLVWTIHYLDEAGPGMYRQPQVSFNSRLPRAFPAYDAATMHTAPRLYYESTSGEHQLNVLRAMKEQGVINSDSHLTDPEHASTQAAEAENAVRTASCTPRVLLLSKHTNGSLNLWNISFLSTLDFANAISVTHLRRICGHRFHAIASTCHPVLPFLLSTSHFDHSELDPGSFSHSKGHCTELILWKVMPIGPLSRSGGIVELARVNSPICSAFLHVAWLPNLLPISSLTNENWTSPSSLFIASNGLSLRVYQAVFDARFILNDLKSSIRKDVLTPTGSEDEPPLLSARRPSMSAPAYNIISHQSTGKPGCIIDLLPLRDAEKSWNNIQLMHVFQEKLVTASSSSLPHCDKFFLVIFQKLSSRPAEDVVYGTGVHAWQIDVACNGGEDNDLDISSNKVCYQMLPLPAGVAVLSASVAVAHLSSSSIYPACSAPYLISTACSDGQVYFWKCKFVSEGVEGGEEEEKRMVWLQWKPFASLTDSRINVSGELLCVSCAYSGRVAVLYKLPSTTSQSVVRQQDSREDQKMKYTEMFSNLQVAIYQCESTGGSEWCVEDRIPLKCIPLPNILFNIDPSIHLPEPPSHAFKCKRQMTLDTRASPHHPVHSAATNFYHEPKRSSIPSSASLHNLSRMLSTHTPKLPTLSRPIVFLDWVSTENGSHILTVGVGSRIILYAPTNQSFDQATKPQDEAKPDPFKRGKLQKSLTLAKASVRPQKIRWLQVRSIELQTHDGMAPFPKHVSWVRNGILVVGLDNEMQVYSQWPDFSAVSELSAGGKEKEEEKKEEEHKEDHKEVKQSEKGLLPRNQSLIVSMNKSLSSAWLLDSVFADKSGTEHQEVLGGEEKSNKVVASGVLGHDDFNKVGLFEAARIATPCIPQFHPKLLLELLNFGKVKRVKVVLWHLLRCIVANQQLSSTAKTALAECMTGTRASETDDTLNAACENEGPAVESIPPLPLYALLAADEVNTADVADPKVKAKGAVSKEEDKGEQYQELFSYNQDPVLNDDPFIDLDPDASAAKEQQQQQAKIVNLGPPGTFGPSQASTLSKYLTRTSLPGLSSLDQMYLLALAETVASTRLEFAEQSKVAGHENSAGLRNGSMSSDLNGQLSADSIVDNCGLRFLLASRHFTYLLNTLPLRQRAHLLKRGLSSSEFIWAFHSDSQQELVDSLPCMQKNAPTWAELKLFGVGWWFRSAGSLCKLIEKVAKASFQSSKDPLDCALFYIAMRKKNILWGLFRSVNDSRMAQFFKNDFSEDRWRKAALKNAFKLIGLQKFQCAAAFFLLAGAVKDAVEVCLKNMDDIQLAMVVLRLHEGSLGSSDHLTYKSLLRERVLGMGVDEEGSGVTRSFDPFLRSMALWVLNDYSGALETLLEEDEEPEELSALSRQSSFKVKSRTPLLNRGLGYSGSNLGGVPVTTTTTTTEESSQSTARSSVFNFYVFLRTHPLIIRHQQQNTRVEKQFNQADYINSVERRLFYTTAHEHFINGCPILTLEVLMKLNPLIKEEEEEEDGGRNLVKERTTGEETNGVVGGGAKDTASGMKAEDFDWSQPLSMPEEPKLELDFNISPVSSPSSSIHASQNLSKADEESKSNDKSCCLSDDIMAQQLKFVACLRMITDELSTLATGFGLDGGQLRFHLYYWLEKEVNVLKQVCNYYLDEVSTDDLAGEEEAGLIFKDDLTGKSTSGSQASLTDTKGAMKIPKTAPLDTDTAQSSPTLHDVIVEDTRNLDARTRRLRRRHAWLKANQNLLVTLLGCTVLHGFRDTGFASIRTELLLLIQELQQDPSLSNDNKKDTPSLFTPLPLLNTTFLTSTSIHATLIQHLQDMCYDIMVTLINMHSPPDTNNYNSEKILNLFNVGLSLSSCMHQSLSDNDTFSLSDASLASLFNGMGHSPKASHLMTGGALEDIHEAPTSEPIKWPGVDSFLSLMHSRPQQDTSHLHILLLETFFSVFLSLLTYALANYDAHLLYHLVARRLGKECWGAVFGGGARVLVKVLAGGGVADEEVCKHRVKLATAAIGAQALHQRYNVNRSSYKEKFVRPKMSVFDFFLSDPSTGKSTINTKTTAQLPSNAYSYPGDNEEEDEEEEESDMSDDDDESSNNPRNSLSKKRKEAKTDTTHLRPDSLAWKLLRYAVVRCANMNLSTFLLCIGHTVADLANSSALLSEVTRKLVGWEAELKKVLDTSEEKLSIPGLYVDEAEPPNKFHSLLQPHNSPFRSSQKAARPVKRLWFSLASNPHIQDVFIKYVFSSQRPEPLANDLRGGKEEEEEEEEDEPMKIIHKDQEIISAFAINQVNLNCLVMATNKELIEVDLSSLLDTPSWLQHDLDYDIESLKNKLPQYEKPEDFLLLKTPYDHRLLNGSLTSSSHERPSKHHSSSASTIITKRPEAGVKKLDSHPLLPFYVSGSVDGCVRLWEWGQPKAVSQVRKAGAFPKVTKVLFNSHGNKIGISDGEGNLSLWKVGTGSNINKPFLNLKCNNKTTYDFTFISSSSLLGTAGHSSDHKNLAIWDSLMPSRKMLVQSFVCHPEGCPAVIYVASQQILISGGKKGEICIFDLRQRQLRHTMQAHTSAIRCLSAHSSEDVFVSGAADGDVKLWSLSQHHLLHTFPGEHSKPASAIFRNVSSGVLQLNVNSQGHLFSCGNDGSMKIRRLFDIRNHATPTHHATSPIKSTKSSLFSAASSARTSRVNSVSVF